MALITQRPDYDLSEGLKHFASEQVEGQSVNIQVKYNVTSGKLRMEMSTDGVDFDEIAGSTIDLDSSDDTFTYRLTQTTPGMYVRLVAVEGVGTIEKINILT